MIKRVAYIPYHDWRKIEAEGNRTRDAHFIDSFRKNKHIEHLIIINRPITYAELLIKKRSIRTKLQEELIYKSKGGRLYKVDDQTYLVDFILHQNMLQIKNGRKWFFSAYGNEDFVSFYKKCLIFLEIKDVPVITANVFSYQFIKKIHSKKIFDAWDNFYLIPGLNNIKEELFIAYQNLAKDVSCWITNSEENKSFYTEKYNASVSDVVKNGVDADIFCDNQKIPKDLKRIKDLGNLIAGFGGKITHLFDVEIFNFITLDNPSINFVIIGQILDKSVFLKIKQRNNVFYLGDKHYQDYANYISNIDIGIIPYRIKENQHGGDSIKAYEYLSAGLIVVGTRGNGLQSLEEYINISETKEAFSNYLKFPHKKKKFITSEFSWKNKAQLFLDKIE